MGINITLGNSLPAGLATPVANPPTVDANKIINNNSSAPQNAAAIDGQTSNTVSKGEWRAADNAAPQWYPAGQPIPPEAKPAAEYYEPLGGDGTTWTHLNTNGRLADVLKERPAGISDFDWKGHEQVSADKVPAQYSSAGKTVSIPNTKPVDADRALLYYIEENFGQGLAGDLKGRMFDEAKQKGVKVDGFEVINGAGENSTVSVKLSAENLGKLRDIAPYYHDLKARGDEAARQGAAYTEARLRDFGRGIPNTVITMGEQLLNAPKAIIEAAQNPVSLVPGLKAVDDATRLAEAATGVKLPHVPTADSVYKSMTGEKLPEIPSVKLPKLEYETQHAKENYPAATDGAATILNLMLPMKGAGKLEPLTGLGKLGEEAAAVKAAKAAEIAAKVESTSQAASNTASARVAKPGGRVGELKSYATDADVPTQYRSDSRFKKLAEDPDHAGATKSETRAEAMAGLEAETQGLIKKPIERGPKGTEFYDADGKPWDVKAPPSPKAGEPWTFNAEKVGKSLLKELRDKATPPNAPAGTFPHGKTGLPEPRRIILDSTYMNDADHASLWQWLNKNLTAEELGRIVEVTTKR